jgi:hypothetical protein
VPAWTRTPSARIIRAGSVRLFLARIPWPVRLLLGPITVAGYLTAWTLDRDDPAERGIEAIFAGVILLALTVGWFEIIALILEGARPS